MYFDQVKFGNRLRNLRKQRGKTQEQLAAAVNIGTVHLGNIELGKRGLSIDLMIELSNVLNVSLDYLIPASAHFRRLFRQSCSEQCRTAEYRPHQRERRHRQRRSCESSAAAYRQGMWNDRCWAF